MENNRGTGKTQRMLEAAIVAADAGEAVMVVANDAGHAAELSRRIAALLKPRDCRVYFGSCKVVWGPTSHSVITVRSRTEMATLRGMTIDRTYWDHLAAAEHNAAIDAKIAELNAHRAPKEGN